MYCALNLVWFPVRATLNKGGPPNELSSKGSTGAQAENLLMMHPEKHRVKDSVGQFLQTSDTGQDMQEESRQKTWLTEKETRHVIQF